jgi:hypothetical protein
MVPLGQLFLRDKVPNVCGKNGQSLVIKVFRFLYGEFKITLEFFTGVLFHLSNLYQRSKKEKCLNAKQRYHYYNAILMETWT